jgi:hypothetical protein
MRRAGRPGRAVLGLQAGLAALAAGCASVPAPPEPVPAPAVWGLTDLMERPAERALYQGLRAYEDGRYGAAEAALQQALQAGLGSPRDRASAHKLLGFIACTSGRPQACELAFAAALAADPGLVLTRAEAGHPVWGPVFQRVSGLTRP